MRIIGFDQTDLREGAHGRIKGLPWRASLNALFGFSGALALESIAWPFAWACVFVLFLTAEYFVAKRFLAATDQKAIARWSRWFALACFLSNLMFVVFTAYVGMNAGDAGRILSLIMASSALASAFLAVSNAPAFMFFITLPAIGWLSAMAFIPMSGREPHPVVAAIAIVLSVAGYLTYLARAAFRNGEVTNALRSAIEESNERRLEAENKRAEAEQANRAKTDFLTTMTHELRTPLNAVIGYSEIIAEDMEIEGRNDLAGDARRINSAARHLLGLIDQILQMTTIDSSRMDLNLDNLDVRVLIEKVVESVSSVAQEGNNRISTRISSDVTTAYTDGEKLGVCLAQIVSNAVKFTQNGLVAISADIDGMGPSATLRIAVSDTGCGMTPEQLDKAFQPFTQIDGSMTRAQGGMGLGLSITLRTIQVLGGEVLAVSEPGVGSTFTLRVPLRMRPAQSEAQAETLSSVHAAA